MKTLKLLTLALAFVALSVSCGKKENPEDSGEGGGGAVVPTRKIFDEDLFEKVTDQSGVVSYLLKSGIAGWECSQSNYFNTRSLTNDERFLFFFGSNSNFPTNQSRGGVILDLFTGKFYRIDGCKFSCCPFLDVETDILYYAEITDNKSRAQFYYRDLLNAPDKAVKLCDLPTTILPKSDRPIQRLATHLTLTKDRKKVFLDMKIMDSNYKQYVSDQHFTYYQGLLDLTNGKFEEWDHGEVHLTHGQLNPNDDNVALLATDSYSYTAMDGTTVNVPIKKDADGYYPRIQIMTRDRSNPSAPTTSRMTMIPDVNTNRDGGYASHERWDETGLYVYWCSDNACIRSVKNARNKDRYTKYPTPSHASHCFFNTPRDLITYDDQSPDYYRSCEWKVNFYNIKTSKEIKIHTKLPRLVTKDEINNNSTLASAYQNWHTDPHPQFVCKDKYIICTAQRSDKTIRLSITPVDQLIKLTN